MGKTDTDTGKRRLSAVKIAVLLAFTGTLLSACYGTVNAGSVPERKETVTAAFGETQTISWFNGYEQKEADLTVGKPVSDKPENLMVPEQVKDFTPDLCSLWFAKLDGDGIEDLRPVYAGDENGHNFVRGDSVYPAIGYALDDHWYAFPVPNGVTEFSICAGNGIFYPLEEQSGEEIQEE